jgi:hypothetical protein
MIDIRNKSYGRLKVIRITTNRAPDGSVLWLCRCSCGRRLERRGTWLRSGHLQSCGCLRGENNKQHGECQRTPEYEVWRSIKQRCYNRRNEHYRDYGGRGIGFFEEWRTNYAKFLEYVLLVMGRRPSTQHSIDRINNDGNYEPGNIRWATKKVQANNQRKRR